MRMIRSLAPAIALILVAAGCEGPVGPEGPMGPQGPGSDHDQYVDVTDHGANPDDGIDDQPAIRSAIESALERGIAIVVFPGGVYDVATADHLMPSADLPENLTLHFIGQGNVVIRKDPTSDPYGLFFIFDSSPSDGGANLSFSGLTFDGSSRIATAIRVISDHHSDDAYFMLENCRFLNFRQVNPVTRPSAAVSVTAEYTMVSIRDVLVDGVSRENPASFSTGIEFANLIGVAQVENLLVRSVTTPDDKDADGLKLFGKSEGDGKILGKAVVRDSYFKNCEGRGVKLQLTDAFVTGNTFEHDSGKTIANYHSIDAQSGGGILSDNLVLIHGNVDMGNSAMPFLVQAHTNGYGVHARIERNTVLSDETIAYFTGVSHPTMSPVRFIIYGNVFASYSGSAEGTVTTFCKYLFDTDAANAHLALILNDNVVNSGWRLLHFSKSGTGDDMRSVLSLRVTNNTNLEDAPRNLFYALDSIEVDDFTVSGNTGWTDSP